MIQYHGTPISGMREHAMLFLTGRHALVSYEYQQHLEVVKECSSSFILDNGAFTNWTLGKGGVDEEGYIKWCRSIAKHPGFDWALIPDVITGSESENDKLLKKWPNDIKGVPVYHLHESVKRMVRLANNYPLVAIGSSGQWPKPGRPDWWVRMDEVLGSICKNGVPTTKLHGLRMLDPKIFSRLPLSSADSSNCGRNAARNGHRLDAKFTEFQGAILTAWRIERHNSSEKWSGLDESKVDSKKRYTIRKTTTVPRRTYPKT